jgi:hypothetical protein
VVKSVEVISQLDVGFRCNKLKTSDVRARQTYSAGRWRLVQAVHVIAIAQWPRHSTLVQITCFGDGRAASFEIN